MRKILLLLLTVFLLVGCGEQAVFETLGQIQHQPQQMALAATVQLSLPASAALQTVSAGTDRLYECDGYTLTVQTLEGGNLSRTVQTLSGFAPEKLTILETKTNLQRYDWVWSAMGEDGALLCRAAVVDDGNYHYCVCLIAPAESAASLSGQWNALLASIALSDPQN